MPKRLRSSTLFALGLLALGGCETTDGTEPQDARVWEPSDASVWQPLEIDGGPPMDAGSCDLPLPPLMGERIPRCEASTRDCMLACAADDQPCRDGCLMADAYPPDPLNDNVCSNCVTVMALACADQYGCHSQVSGFLCCNAANCGAGSAPDCATTTCGAQLSAMFQCLGTTAPQCLNLNDPTFAGACFAAPAPSDAGVIDPDGGAMVSDAGVPTDGGM